MTDTPTSNEQPQESPVQPQQVDDIEQSEQVATVGASSEELDAPAGGKDSDHGGSEDEVDGLVSDAGKDTGDSIGNAEGVQEPVVSIAKDETVETPEITTDAPAAQDEPKPQAITEDSLQQHNEAGTATTSTDPTLAAVTSALPLKDSLPSSFARIPSPALSATSSSTPATTAPTAPKKFSSVNVNKKFLSKAASPSPGPAGSVTGGSPLGSPAATAAKPLGSLGGRPISSPLPQSSSTSRLLTGAKLTAVSAAKPSPSLTATTLGRTGSDQGRAGSPGSLILGKRPGLVSTTMQAQQQPKPPPAAKKVWGPVPAAAPAQVGRSVMASSREFPTTREVIEGEKKAIESAQAAAQAQAAHNQAILQQLDSFRGANRDPNGHYWDEDDDEGSEIIDFGDGQTYTIHTNPTEVPPPPEVDDAPVSKAERFGGDDFDRSWPSRPRPAAPPAASAEEAARVLFNAQSNRLEPSSYARASGSQHAPPVQPQRIMPRQPPPHQMSQRRPSSSGGPFERPLPPHLAERGAQTHAPEPVRQERPRDPHASGAGRRPSWGTAMRGDSERPLPPHLVARGTEGAARAPLPPQSATFASQKSPTLQTHPLDSGPRKSFSQMLKPAVPNPEAPAVAVVQSPPAQSAEVAAPPTPAVNITELQKTEMHTAAERARLRRLAEEAEREAKAERARQKAKEIEDKMAAAAAAKAAAAAPPPPPTSALIPSPQPAKQDLPAGKPPTQILARKPSQGTLATAGVKPSVSPQPPAKTLESPVPPSTSQAASAPPPASANLPKKPPGRQSGSQPVFPGANVVFENGLWQGKREGAEKREGDSEAIEVLDFSDLSKLAPGSAGLQTGSAPLQQQQQQPPPTVVLPPRSARDEWRRPVKVEASAQRELPPHLAAQAAVSSSPSGLVPEQKAVEERSSAQSVDASKPRKESNFEDTLARLKAVMRKPEASSIPAARGPVPPVSSVDAPKQAKPSGPSDPPELFDVTQLPPPPLPLPAWNRFVVRLPSGSGPIRPALATWRLKAFDAPVRVPSRQWPLSWQPACESLNLNTLMREDVFMPRRWNKGALAGPRVRLPPPPGSKPILASKKADATIPAVQAKVDESALTVSSEAAASMTSPTKALRQLREFKPRAFDDASWRRKAAEPSSAEDKELSGKTAPAPSKSNVAELANSALASALANETFDDMATSKQGVRFMVSSELEGDSLLDEVNKMSLETVGEGSPDRAFEKNAASLEEKSVPAGETPKTPPTTSGTSSRGQASSPTSAAQTPWSKSSISYSTSTQSPARGHPQHDHLKSVWSQPSQTSAPQENSLRGVMDEYPTSLQFDVRGLPEDQPKEAVAEDAQSPMYPSIHASTSNDNLLGQGVNGYSSQGNMYGSPLGSHPSMSPHGFVPRPSSTHLAGPGQSYGYLGGVGPSSSTSPVAHHMPSHFDSRYGRNAPGVGSTHSNIISNQAGLPNLNSATHGVWTTLPVGSAVPSPTWNHSFAPKASGQMAHQNVAAMHAFGSVGKDDPRAMGGFSPHQPHAQLYGPQGGYGRQAQQDPAYGRSPVQSHAYAYGGGYGQAYSQEHGRGQQPSVRPGSFANGAAGEYGNRGFEGGSGFRAPGGAFGAYQQGGQATRGGPPGQSRRQW